MDFYEIMLILALLVTVYYKFQGKRQLILFDCFIFFVVIFELFVEYYYFKIFGSNLIILNFYSRFCIYYYLFIYWHYFKARRWGFALRRLIQTYIVITLLVFIIIWPDKRIDYITYNIGMLIVLPLIGIYLYDKVYNQNSNNIFQDPYLYFSFGLLIFYTAAFPILGFINLLIVNNPFYKDYTVLLNIGNIFLSLAYLGVALCSKIPKQSIGLSSPHS